MSTGPTFYYPTTDQPYLRSIPAIKYYYDNAGNTVYEVGLDKQLEFYTDPGNTYTGPLGAGGLHVSYISNRKGITLSDPAYSLLEIFKQIPIERRGLQPTLFNLAYLWQFTNDKVNPDFGYWPDNGISFTQQWANEVFNSMAQAGATLSYLMIDNEIPTSTIVTPYIASITGATQYTLPWRGLSSWYDYYLLEGGQTSYNFSNTTQGNINSNAFYAAWNRIQNKAMEDSFVGPLKTYNPNANSSDYMEFTNPYISGYTGVYILDEYGTPVVLTHRAAAGNAQSPVLYGWFASGSVADRVNFKEDTPAVYAKNPTIIFTYGNSYKESVFDKYFTLGPWSSFIQCVSQMKQCKLLRPDLPITPWIPSPWQIGQYSNDYGTIYKRDPLLWPQSKDQIRPEIVHNRWRFKEINTETGGFSGPTGLTNGIRIITNSTSTQKLLSYVYNGITSGVTYVFSYYVNLGCGYTGFAAGFNNFRRTHYGKPTGITFYQYLPSATGPFYSTGGIYYPPGSSGWTQVQFKFSVPSDDPLDPIFNPTLEVAVIEDSKTSGGNTMFITDPRFEIESSPSNISVITPTSILSEDNQILGARGPACGFAQATVGYNPRSAMYITDRPGNSAYFYELIRHCCLLGTKAFGWFNNFSFIDNSYPGARAYGFNNQEALETGKQIIALTRGFSGFIEDYKLMNETLYDVHQKIKGFTTATAGASERWNWSLPYFASASPDTKGQTWWWRITVQNGYTLYVNGMTLPDSNGRVGMWFGTTGPTLAGVSITHTAPIPPSEPTGFTALREFHFNRMSSLADLTGNSLSFSRGSSGSFIGASGFLVTVGSGQPRFHYDPDTLICRGLLLEAAVSNQLNWSESFASTGGAQNNWIDTNLSRTTGNTSPSNDISAIRFTATGSNATLISSNASSNTTNQKVFSFWCRGITGNESLSYTINGGTSWYSVPNISTKWKRFAFGPGFSGYFSTTAETIHHVGFRLGNTSDSVMIWGAQLENFRFSISGEFVGIPTDYNLPPETSYIRTTNTTANRNADSLSFPGGTSWLGNTYGTIVFESENVFPMPANVVQINSGDAGICGGINLTFATTVGGYRIDLNDRRFGPNIQTVISNGYYLTTRFPGPNIPYKICVSWSPNGFKTASNSVIKTIPYSQPFKNAVSFSAPQWGTIKMIKSYDRVFEDNILRQFSLAGVTQIGWLNNGDGIPHPVTYYNANENS